MRPFRIVNALDFVNRCMSCPGNLMDSVRSAGWANRNSHGVRSGRRRSAARSPLVSLGWFGSEEVLRAVLSFPNAWFSGGAREAWSLSSRTVSRQEAESETPRTDLRRVRGDRLQAS